MAGAMHRQEFMSADIDHLARIDQLLGWLGRNRNQLLAAILILAVLALCFAWYSWQQTAREQEAAAALIALRGTVDKQGVYHPTPAPEFVMLADKFRGTKAANRALLLAGVAFFREGKYAEARAQFERFLAENPRDELAIYARYGVAICAEAMGKLQEATEILEAMVKAPNAGAIQPRALLALARIHRAMGKIDRARQLYEELYHKEGANLIGYQAEQALEELRAGTNTDAGSDHQATNDASVPTQALTN